MIIEIIKAISYGALIFLLILMAISSKKRLRQLRKEKEKLMKNMEELIKKKTEEVQEFFSNLDKKTKKMEEDLHRKESYKQGICDDIVNKE